MAGTQAKPNYCQATRKDGKPCTGRPSANGLCFAHQPTQPAAWAKGGRNRSNAVRAAKAMPIGLQPVAALLSVALQEVYAGTLDPRTGSALASLASAICKVYQVSEFEERLRVVESTLAGSEPA
jgi:hypothetical protein